MTKQGNPRGEHGDPGRGTTPRATISDRFAYRAFLRKNRAMDLTYRITVGLVGVTIIVIGIILLPLPGPWLADHLRRAVRAEHRVRVGGATAGVRPRQGPGLDRVGQGAVAAHPRTHRARCLLIVAAALLGYVALRGVPAWIPLIG